MPKFVYKPEGADPREWDFTFGRIMSSERIVMERLTGFGWDEIQRKFWDNHTAIIHALLFVLLKRDLPTIKADEVEFCDDDFEVDVTDAEAQEALERLEAIESPDEDEADALAQLRVRLADVPKADQPEG